jgi:hypothetical protein
VVFAVVTISLALCLVFSALCALVSFLLEDVPASVRLQTPLEFGRRDTSPPPFLIFCADSGDVVLLIMKLTSSLPLREPCIE